MFSLDKPEELIKMRLISSLKNILSNSPTELEKLFSLSQPDIIVVDKNQEIALLVDIQLQEKQSKKLLSEVTQLYLQNAEKDIRFAMSANLQNITIFKSNSEHLLNPVISLFSADILSHYEPEFSKRKILYLYLRTLIEAWLRDLAYHWKSEIPPGTKELSKIGLLEKMKDGDTYTQDE
ncbi:hypothetical protein IQ227_00820 [Anabaena aphanizomenioides LEGE 00250]|uniref:Type I restriction enzyme R protein N-terminal domain-containing protein n=1 Tax=Sphaerospermopsis aphanizomenoides LEGE 00250 TaxID=2777972 RepID=A0ABR9V7Z7_9CYAN|nr:hypothetical protein [Sphaerospermopsis aphanizomenoides]MBE9234613.1 hypothetical protein [Sphaerospermopsis aphanizomenoides LEGE 00250]